SGARRRVYNGPAFFSRVGADLGEQYPNRAVADVRKRKPASGGAIPGERAAVEHASVCEGVSVQHEDADGPRRSRALQDLVIYRIAATESAGTSSGEVSGAGSNTAL